MILPVIDLKLGAKRIHQDQAAALKMIDMFKKTIQQEINAIKNALAKQDWENIFYYNHRLLGALRYCGLPRLEVACEKLQLAEKEKTNGAQLLTLTEGVLMEMSVISDR